MARMKEDERYSLWTQRISDAERILKDRMDESDRFLRFYRMDLKNEEALPDDTVWLNYQFGISRVILPSIYFRNPDVLVRSRKQDPLLSARAHLDERLLNYQIDEIGFENEMRRIIFDCLYYGFGVMKFGYAPALEKPGRDNLYDLTFEEIFEDVSATDNPDERITIYNPFAVRVGPRFFRVDPLATSLIDSRWVIHTILRPVEEVKKSKIYPKKLTVGMEGTNRLPGDKVWNTAGSSGAYWSGIKLAEYNNLVMLYEIWDREENKLYVMDSYNKNQGDRRFLREEDNPYDIEGFPFEMLVFNHDPDGPYGVADAKVWENPIQAVNLINTMHYNHIKRFTRKYKCPKGMLAEGAESKLTNPYDGAVVELITSLAGGGVDQLQPLEDAPMSSDAYNLREILKAELNALTGITEQRRGVIERSKTATEASLLEQQARIRDSDRLYIVSKFVERSVRKLLQLDRQFLGIDYVASVVGPQEAALWQNASKQVIQSEVDVQVRVGSSAYVSREVRVKQLLDFLNLTANLQEMDPATGMPRPVVNVREIIRRIADGLDLDDYESLLAPAAAPPVQSGPAPAIQSTERRTGSPDLADLLANVQNLGVRRTGANAQMAG